MDRIYSLVDQAKEAAYNGRMGTYHQLNHQIRVILDCVTEGDIKKNAMVEHPLLHETAEQLVTHNGIERVLDTFKAVWDHPKMRPLWDNPNYTDTYNLTAAQRLAINLCRDTSLPAVKWIMETIKVRPVRFEFDIYGRYVKTNDYKIVTP